MRDIVRRLGAQRWFARTARVVAPTIDRAVHRLTGGRVRIADAFLPTLVLTVTGRKTGKPRQIPLGYVRHGDAFAVVATNWGQDHDPLWAKNLQADRDATVEVDGRTIPVRGRRATRTEFDVVWPQFTHLWPAYGAYEDRIGSTREIPMFFLEPLGHS